VLYEFRDKEVFREKFGEDFKHIRRELVSRRYREVKNG
jgi:hypothetical protein